MLLLCLCRSNNVAGVFLVVGDRRRQKNEELLCLPQLNRRPATLNEDRASDDEGRQGERERERERLLLLLRGKACLRMSLSRLFTRSFSFLALPSSSSAYHHSPPSAVATNFFFFSYIYLAEDCLPLPSRHSLR